MRQTVSPIFTSSKMKLMHSLLLGRAQDFANMYEEKAKRGDTMEFDALDAFSRFTSDAIGAAVLGFEADCVRNENSVIFRFVKQMLHDFVGVLGTLKLTAAFIMPRVYMFLGIQAMSKDVYTFFKRVVFDEMSERERNNSSAKPDMIQLLLEAKKVQRPLGSQIYEKEVANFSANIEEYNSTSGTVSHFSDDDWIAQGFLFYGAGYANQIIYLYYKVSYMNIDT